MRPDASQVAGRVLLTKSVVQLEDALADPDYDQRFPHAMGMGWRRMLGVPMLRHGDPLGVIVVGWAEPGPVSSVHEGLLKQFADQAVIALENVRLFTAEQHRTRELYEALEQQTATSELLRVIASSPTDLQPVLDAVAETAARICGANDAMVRRVDGNLLRLAAQHGNVPSLDASASIPVDRGSGAGRAVVDRQTIHIQDMDVEREFPVSHALAQRFGYRTVLATPLLRKGLAIGAIVIRRLEVRP